MLCMYVPTYTYINIIIYLYIYTHDFVVKSECTMVFGKTCFISSNAWWNLRAPAVGPQEIQALHDDASHGGSAWYGSFFFRPPQILVDFSSMSHLIIGANQV